MTNAQSASIGATTDQGRRRGARGDGSSARAQAAPFPGLGPDAVDVTLDAFFGGRFFAYQQKLGPRASMDALFLAAAVPQARGRDDTFLEAGAGSGVVSLALAARGGGHKITAVEQEPSQLALLRRNIEKNALQHRIIPVAADIEASADRLCKAGLVKGTYTHVLANPPFFDRGTVRVPPQPARARAHSAAPGALAAWVRFLAAMCAAKGSLTLIYRPEGLPALFSALTGRFGGLTLFPLYPHAGEPARRILLQGRKGSRAPLRLMPGLVLHHADGSYTSQAEAVLREGKVLDMTGGMGP